MKMSYKLQSILRRGLLYLSRFTKKSVQLMKTCSTVSAGVQTSSLLLDVRVSHVSCMNGATSWLEAVPLRASPRTSKNHQEESAIYEYITYYNL